MTLLMRDQENIEKGIAQGKVYGAVSVYRDMGLSEGELLKRIQEKYHLTKEGAEKYLLTEMV